MIQKLAVVSSLVLSATCMVLHQPLPLHFGLQYNDNPSYNFAYEVNDAHTGDIKNQHETRRGDTVLGQYSLVQPDGIRRTVDYRADDHTGFQATVNNDGRAALAALEATRLPSLSAQSYQQRPAPSAYPSSSYPSSAYPSSAYPSPTYPSPAYPSPTPISAVSSSSFVQTVSHSPVAHNPWP